MTREEELQRNQSRRRAKRNGSVDLTLDGLIKRETDIVNQENSALTKEVQQVLTPFTLNGRINQGHGAFCGRYRDPDMTIESVENKSKNKSLAFKNLRNKSQCEINRITNYVNALLNVMVRDEFKDGLWEEGMAKTSTLTYDGKPLGGVKSYTSWHLSSREAFLQGIISSGYLDSDIWREEVNERARNTLYVTPDMDLELSSRIIDIRKKPLRRGVCLAIDLDMLKKFSWKSDAKKPNSPKQHLRMSDLKNPDSQTRIQFLIKMGYLTKDCSDVDHKAFIPALQKANIAKDLVRNNGNPRIVCGYVQLKGHHLIEDSTEIGVSDDIANIFNGLLIGDRPREGLDGMAGVNCGDFMDTLAKCCDSISYKGPDTELADRVRKRYLEIKNKELIPKEKAMLLLYLSRRQYPEFPSSSQRHFFLIHNEDVPNNTQCAMDIYQEFVYRAREGTLASFFPPDVRVDFENILVKDVLRRVVQRYNEVREECQATGMYPMKYLPNIFDQEMAKWLTEPVSTSLD